MGRDDETTTVCSAHEASDAHIRAPRMWRRLVATLVYDSSLHPRGAGIRAVATGWPRLMYAAHGVEIDLEICPSSAAGRLRVLGQVTTGESEPGRGRATIERAGAELMRPSTRTAISRLMDCCRVGIGWRSDSPTQ
jgi:hypothetical protein